MVEVIGNEHLDDVTKTKSRSNYLFELIFTIFLTLILFTMLTIPHLQHSVGFIFPVPLAVFIIQHKVKDGIFPAIFMIVCAAIITHFLPLGGGSYVRGLLLMTTAMTIGFLHGALYKTQLSHLHEIIIVIVAELILGIIMTIIFYLLRDPVFAFDLEFAHYFANLKRLFALRGESIYAQNVEKVFLNMVIPYTIALSVVSVLLTHIFIHLAVKYIYERSDDRPFTGLIFTVHPLNAFVYLVGLLLCGVSLFLMRQPLGVEIMNIIIALFILVLSVSIIFILQGVLVTIYFMRIKHEREYSLGIFILALTFPLIFSVLGALNVITRWSDKLIANVTNIVSIDTSGD